MLDEKWWSGVVNEAYTYAHASSANHTFKMLGDNDENQVQLLLFI